MMPQSAGNESSDQSRIWLIAGASSGFGLELTKLALENGDSVIALYRSASTPSTLSALECSRLLCLQCDISHSAQIEQAFSVAESTFGRIDVVFNAAGIALLGEVEGTPEDEARRLFDVNFWGMSLISREAIRVFRDVNSKNGTRGGRLLNMSSGSGVAPNPGLAYYSASKHGMSYIGISSTCIHGAPALEGFTEALAKEMDPAWNIKITILELGAFKTRAHTDNTTTFPPHPAYASNPNLGSNLVRHWFADGSGITGDPVLGAKRIYDFAGLEGDVPMRLQLGDDAWHGIKAKLEGVIEEQHKFEDWHKGLKLA